MKRDLNEFCIAQSESIGNDFHAVNVRNTQKKGDNDTVSLMRCVVGRVFIFLFFVLVSVAVAAKKNSVINCLKRTKKSRKYLKYSIIIFQKKKIKKIPQH